MANHPIESLMTTTMENIRRMIDVNTIIGTPIESADGSLIIPISRVSFGFASAGSEFCEKKEKVDFTEGTGNNYPFGGGSGAGVSIKPAAFLVLKDNAVKLLPVDYQNSYDKMLDTVPQLFELIKDSIEKHKNDKDKINDTNIKNDESSGFFNKTEEKQ